MAKYEVRGVTSSAKKSSAGHALTHLVTVDSSGDAVAVSCKRIQLKHVFPEAVIHTAEKGHEAAAMVPTCPVCLAAWQKMA